MEWCFRVRLTSVVVKGVSGGVDRPAGSTPYYRCDFDGKIMQSELFTAVGDPAWDHRATFDYRLDEDDMQRAIASLTARSVRFDVFYTDGVKHVRLGGASQNLFSIATGAATIQLTLHGDRGEPVGVLHASLSMEHLSVVSVELAAASLYGLPEPSQTQLSFFLLHDSGAAPVTSRVTAATKEPQFDFTGPLILRTSLRALFNNVLRVQLVDVVHNASVMASVDVEMRELLVSNANHSTCFKKNMYSDAAYHRPFTAHVTATVSFSDLPRFAQLANGLNNDGSVHGKPLLPSCVTPPGYSKFPARLPDYERPAALPTPVAPVANDHSTLVVPSTLPLEPDSLRSGRPSAYAVAATSPQRIVSPPRRTPAVAPRPGSPARTPHYTMAGGAGASMRSRSPLAAAGTALAAHHDEALSAIDFQRRRAENLAAELHARTEHEQRAEAQRAEAIAAEDRALHDRFEACTRNTDELRRAQDELEAEHGSELKAVAAQRAALETELADLADAEAQLHALLSTVQHHADADAVAREAARRQADEARMRLDSDSMALTDMETRIATRSRARVSPPRRADSPGQRSGTQSPRRLLGAATAAELLDCIVSCNETAFHRIVTSGAVSLRTEHHWLLRACSAANLSESIVAHIVRERPELVHMIDPQTGNTPLHNVCQALRPDPAVASLLLNNGANAAVYNLQGYTPMHLALLNTNDVDDGLRRALLNRAGVATLQQPTARGESPAHLCAVHDRHLQALRFLGNAGAAMNSVAVLMVDARPTPSTPLDVSRRHGLAADACARFLERYQ